MTSQWSEEEEDRQRTGGLRAAGGQISGADTETQKESEDLPSRGTDN